MVEDEYESAEVLATLIRDSAYDWILDLACSFTCAPLTLVSRLSRN